MADMEIGARRRETSYVKREASESGTRYASHLTRNILDTV